MKNSHWEYYSTHANSKWGIFHVKDMDTWEYLGIDEEEAKEEYEGKKVFVGAPNLDGWDIEFEDGAVIAACPKKYIELI